MRDKNRYTVTFEGDKTVKKDSEPIVDTVVDKESETALEQPRETSETHVVETVVPEEEDAYAEAVGRLFASHQTFQESMTALTKTLNPALMFSKLVPILETFQTEITQFKSTEFEVEEKFEEGHGFLLSSLEKYETFLTDYPKVLSGKGGLKAMKKVHKLGKLSGEADKELKMAFRSFDKALQEVE
ncbi:hypothetical protein [Rossellomorea marisflavi]|uniref:hypothetical protein n=1 Tax=Rossellomorea marisflavi TaxID=189381 RepID=UPI003F9EC62C